MCWALTGRGKPLATLYDVGLVELLEFQHFVEFDVVGEFNVAYDAARASVQRMHWWLQSMPAMFMSQGHIMGLF